MSSSRLTNVAVAAVAVALAGGGVFIGLRGLDDDAEPDSLPEARRPPVTAPAPEPADVETIPAVTQPGGGGDDGLLPVPNVIGVNEAVARTRLVDFDVQVAFVDTTIPEDFDEVTSQDPAAAARIAPGAPVDLVFSSRPVPESVASEPIPLADVDAIDVDSLAVGDCGVFRVADRLLVYDPIDCAMAHDLELIADFDLEDGPAAYDEDVVGRLVEDRCDLEYETYVGLAPDDSQLISLSIRPNPTRYDSEGERASNCAVRSLDGTRIVGSAQGSFW